MGASGTAPPGYLYKSVFIVRDDEDEARDASTLLEQAGAPLGTSASQAQVLHRYAADGRLVNADAFDEAYAAAVSSHQQPQDAPLPVSRKAVLAIAPAVPLAPLWAPVGFPLAILAIRDIRRANGFLRGETLAHLAIVLYGLVLSAGAILGGYAIYNR